MTTRNDIPTAEELPGFALAERRRVGLLRRRRAHLERMLDRGERSGGHSWVAAEVAALTWALNIVVTKGMKERDK